MLARQLKWALFSVVMALVPFLFNWLRIVSRPTADPKPLLQVLLGHGELLLVATALTASAVGDLLGGASPRTTLKLVSGAAAVLVLAAASYYFADISAGFANKETIREDIVCKTSLWLFFFSVVTGAVCVGLSEGKG
jgi:hypothetical protein